MRVFKTKRFTKWAKKERLTDATLFKAVREMGQGLVGARLGGQVYKKRIGAEGRGKRGSFRTILAFKMSEKAFFIFGFAKHQLANIDEEQLDQLKILASCFMRYDDHALKHALKENELIEVYDE
ncbi:MAG TPA: type II toxin-antitoxin system RelE/ParE family toxin [Coxiellaceae bacterium]|nr:type II toxin-antitoxin system RelE/ParE family toxin [Coxiellaceae bacterium]